MIQQRTASESHFSRSSADRRLPAQAAVVLLLLSTLWCAGCGDLNGKQDAAKKNSPKPPMLAIAVSPDGRTIACCQRGASVLLKDLDTLKTVRTLQFGDRQPTVARFHPSGNSLLVAYYDGSVALWNLRDPSAEPVQLGIHSFDVRTAAFSHDGRWAATGDGAGAVFVWDVAQPLNGYRVLQHRAAVWCVAFSRDDKRIVSGGSDGLIRLWDAASGRELRVFRGHEGTVRSFDMSRDGSLLVSASLDSTIRGWNLADGRELWKMQSPGSGIVSAVLSPDGRAIATASVFSGDIRLWNVRTGKPISTIGAHDLMTTDLAFGRDGTLVSCGMDGEIQTWRVSSDEPRESPASARAISLNDPPQSPAQSRPNAG